uniref:Uncharacterized protein n=1 Tax=Rhizophora mucronata TaxID=61149 RepID=A0A2P2J484_RHIMU
MEMKPHLFFILKIKF